MVSYDEFGGLKRENPTEWQGLSIAQTARFSNRFRLGRARQQRLDHPLERIRVVTPHLRQDHCVQHQPRSR